MTVLILNFIYIHAHKREDECHLSQILIFQTYEKLALNSMILFSDYLKESI